MDHGRVRREPLITIGIVVFLAIAIIKPWGDATGPSPEPRASAAVVTPGPARSPPGAPAGERVASIRIDAAVDRPAVAAGGLWYSRGQTGLIRIDTTTAETTSLEPDGAPFPFALRVTGDGSQLWMIDPLDMVLARLDPITGEVVEQIGVGVAPPYVVTDVYGAIKDVGTLWAVATIQAAQPVVVVTPLGSACCDPLESRVLVRIDTETGQVAQLHQVDGAQALAIGFGTVWVLENRDGGPGHYILVRLRPETGVPIATMGLPDFRAGQGCRPCVPGPRIGRDGVWLAIGPRGRVIRIDPAQNRIVAEIDVGATVADLTIDPDGSVWVVGTDASDGRCLPSMGFLARIDPATDTVVARSTVICPASVVASGGDVWVGGYDAGTAVVERIRPTP